MKSGPWIQVFGGGQFFFHHPEFTVEGIAHHLSCVNRFTGAARVPYSVAEHSFYVSVRAEQLCGGTAEEKKLAAQWGLIHDVSEAFLNDISSPLKSLPELKGYKKLEAEVMRAVCAWLGLPEEMPLEVKKADEQVFFAEAEALMQPLHPDWRSYYGARWNPAPIRNIGMDWRSARQAFLTRFTALFGSIQ